MDRIENKSEVNEPPTPMEIETNDNRSLLEENVTHTQDDTEKILCCKCGACIITKDAARLTLWGHPVECWMFNTSCNDNTSSAGVRAYPEKKWFKTYVRPP